MEKLHSPIERYTDSIYSTKLLPALWIAIRHAGFAQQETARDQNDGIRNEYSSDTERRPHAAEDDRHHQMRAVSHGLLQPEGLRYAARRRQHIEQRHRHRLGATDAKPEQERNCPQRVG